MAALIFVAPAILAPFTMKKNPVKANQNGTQGKSSDSNTKGNPFFRLASLLSGLTKYITEAIVYVIKGMGGMMNSLYQRALSAILRSAFGVTLVMQLFLTLPLTCNYSHI